MFQTSNTSWFLTYFATAIFTLLLSENHNQLKHIVGVKCVNPLQGMNPSSYGCCLQQQYIGWFLLTVLMKTGICKNGSMFFPPSFPSMTH